MIGRGFNALTPNKVPCRVDMRVPDCIAAVATTYMMCYQKTKKTTKLQLGKQQMSYLFPTRKTFNEQWWGGGGD